jgi:hypothetical protein
MALSIVIKICRAYTTAGMEEYSFFAILQTDKAKPSFAGNVDNSSPVSFHPALPPENKLAACRIDRQLANLNIRQVLLLVKRLNTLN